MHGESGLKAKPTQRRRRETCQIQIYVNMTKKKIKQKKQVLDFRYR